MYILLLLLRLYIAIVTTRAGPDQIHMRHVISQRPHVASETCVRVRTQISITTTSRTVILFSMRIVSMGKVTYTEVNILQNYKHKQLVVAIQDKSSTLDPKMQ